MWHEITSHNKNSPNNFAKKKKIAVHETYGGDGLKLLPSGSDAVKFGMYQASSHSLD